MSSGSMLLPASYQYVRSSTQGGVEAVRAGHAGERQLRMGGDLP